MSDMPREGMEDTVPKNPLADLNPFGLDEALSRQPERFSLGGGNVLPGIDSLIARESNDEVEESRVNPKLHEVAATVASLLAESLERNINIDVDDFPECDDFEVFNPIFEQMGETSLGVGYIGNGVSYNESWKRFFDKVSKSYRAKNKIPDYQLIPVTIRVPSWLQNNPRLDILPGIHHVDLKVEGEISSKILTGIEKSKVDLTNAIISDSAIIGNNASKCTFLFRDLHVKASLDQCSNLSIIIAGSFSGYIGWLTTSRVECLGDSSGTVKIATLDCNLSSNLNSQRR